MMKTKQLLPALLFAIALVASTQTAQAQTKEETIAWIKEKFENHVYYGGCCEVTEHTVKIEPCQIVNYVEYQMDGEFYFSLQETFPVTSNIIIEPIKHLKSYYHIVPDVNDNVVHYIEVKYGQKDEGYQRNVNMVNKKGEVNLAERMQKALRHLATFCKKSNEAF